MFSVSYANKYAYSADKSSGVLRDGALGAKMGYVLTHCREWGGVYKQNAYEKYLNFYPPENG